MVVTWVNKGRNLQLGIKLESKSWKLENIFKWTSREHITAPASCIKILCQLQKRSKQKQITEIADKRKENDRGNHQREGKSENGEECQNGTLVQRRGNL